MKPASLLLTLLSLLAFAACGKPRPRDEALSTPPVRVQTAVVTREELPAWIEVTGTVRPVQRAQLAAKIMGAIEELPVSLGQQVRAGDVLVRIAAGEIQAQVTQARAQLNGTRRDLERERVLLGKGASTAETVKALEDRLAGSEARLREAEALLSYAEIRAPFDGVVARRPVNAGDLAAPGALLVEIEGTSKFEIEAAVPESLVEKLRVGTTLRVELPSRSLHFEARIAEISPAADPQARAVLVKLAVPAGAAVRSGQFVRLQVPGEVRPAFFVPLSAVSRLGQMERIFSVGPDQRAVLRLVKTGGVRDDSVEIVAGIAEGDRVIVRPAPGLREGQLTEAARE